MARFLFTAWPFTGHLLPNVAIAHALRKRGHQPAFYTGPRASEFIEGEGFPHFSFKHVDEEQVYRIMFSRQHRPLQWTGLFRFNATLHKWLLGTIPQQVRDLETLLADWRPDVVVCDPTMWSPILIFHETWGIPVAISSFMIGCMLPGPNVPPFGLGLPRPRNWHTRLLARLATFGMNVFAANIRRTANALRESHGLQSLSVPVMEFMGRMPLYLVPSVPELDYDRDDLPPSVHYVGHCLWESPHRRSSPDWMAQLPRNQPWVYVTEGTLRMGDPFILRAAAQGLANLPMQVIMTTGGHRNPAELDLGPIAPNVHVVRFVDHGELLPLTDIVISTGGGGTVQGALSAGVPQVIIPTEWDKPENAQRVVEAGVGLRLAPWRVTPRRLRATAERVLSDPFFRQNAQRVAASFARFGGAERAAELLEELNTRLSLSENRAECLGGR
jgi:MGT family glycosyltransferase